MTIVAIVQARLAARLPNKMLSTRRLAGPNVLLNGCGEPGPSMTSSLPPRGVLRSTARRTRGIGWYCCVRGDETMCSTDSTPRSLGRQTSSSGSRAIAPCMIPEIIDRVVTSFRDSKETLDYASNVTPPTYPDGLRRGGVSFRILRRCGPNPPTRPIEST